MGSYIGPKVRLSRSLQVPIGETDKHVRPRKERPPGQRRFRKARPSLYSSQLRGKQKMRFYYNVRDKQLKHYIEFAQNSSGDTIEIFQQMLESRLDNVVRRLRWARGIWQGRQMVSHGHIMVNGRKINLPSFCVKAGDVVSVKLRSHDFVKQCAQSTEDMGFDVPKWLSVDENTLTAKVLYLPHVDEVRIPFEIDYAKIIEFYTR